jgi:hypothetical protein
MRRRHFIAGLGALVGGGGILGTGAFTSTTADRNATVAVANEDQAYLSLTPSPGVNGGFATQASASNGKKLGLDFDDATGTGSASEGVRQNSRYEFDDVFRVRNQGTQTVFVDVDPLTGIPIPGGSGTGSTAGTVNAEFYVPDGSGGVTLVQGGAEQTPGNVPEVGTGTERGIGVSITTGDGSGYPGVNGPMASEQGSKETTIGANPTAGGANVESLSGPFGT